MLIYGEMGKGGGSSPIEEDDTLNSKQTIRLLHAISNGPIAKVEEVYVNRVKLKTESIIKEEKSDSTGAPETISAPNISGVSADWRDGSENQTIIPGFESVSEPVGEFDTGIISTLVPKVIAIGQDKNRARVTITIERLLHIDDDGNMIKKEVSYGIKVGWDSSFTNTLKTTYRKYGKASSATSFDILINRPEYPDNTTIVPPTWYIEVSRISADDNDGITKQTDFSKIKISAVTAIKDVALNYPGVALIGMAFNQAKKYGSNIPDLIFKVSGIKVKVPSRVVSTVPGAPAADYYNPVTGIYKDAWTLDMADTVLYPSANPAWQILYLLTDSTYGLGIDEEKIDIGAYYEFAKYCDESIDSYTYDKDNNRVLIPGGRRRYELHNQFNEREQAASFLTYFYSIGLAKPIVNRFGLHSVTWERPRSPSILVGNSNVIDGMFTYSSNSIEERYTSVTGIYNDANDLGKTTTVTVPLGSDQTIWHEKEIEIYNTYEKRSIELPMIGCYNRDQAIVKARWFLYRNSVMTGIVSFKVMFDGLSFEIGNVVRIIDDFVEEITQQGRIIGYRTAEENLERYDTNYPSIQFDRAIRRKGGVGHKVLYYGLVDNVLTVVERNVPTTEEDITTSSVYLFSNLAFIPPAIGSIFLLTANDNSTGSLWEIIGLSFDQETKEITVTGAEYDPELYSYMYHDINASHLEVYKEVAIDLYQPPAQVKNISVVYDNEDIISETFTIKWQWFYSQEVEDAYNAALDLESDPVAKTKIPIKNPFNAEYEVHYRHTGSGDTYTTVKYISTMELQIPMPEEGLYEFVIFAINPRGIWSPMAKFSHMFHFTDLRKFTLSIKNIPGMSYGSRIVNMGKKYEVEIIGSDKPARLRLYKNPGKKDVTLDYKDPVTQLIQYQTNFDVISTAESQDFTVEYVNTVRDPVGNYKPFLDATFDSASMVSVDTIPSKVCYNTDNVSVDKQTIDSSLNNKTTIIVNNTSTSMQDITITLYCRVLIK